MTPSPGRIAYHPLMRRLTHGLRRRCGVGEGEAILVAVSGGADSVALLRGLRLLALKRRWRLRLHVGHVQHHLRPPEEAEADAAFVQSLADELSLPFRRRDLEVPAGNTEAQARRQRYAALTRMAQEAGASLIATGHHADDHLETILMRLLRGTRARGLRGIAWRRAMKAEEHEKPEDAEASAIRLIRPMLAATHGEAIAFLHT
ncbi:MAG: tRNA lysidine(34) synthetase TilS, partial [Planctomycetes bacterium]|nr:tRNA lysidine(34) synthetase TilS [Planctomycetota bacterium]